MRKQKPLYLIGLLIASLSFLSLNAIIKLKSPVLTVTSVTDGDTIKLSDGRRIRYIGINSPELETNECFAREAQTLNQNLVLNKKVKIETDINEIDLYGRTLAYVFVDGLFVNQELLAQGAGKFYFDALNTRYSSLLEKAAEEGHDRILGLWQACAPDPQKGCLIKGNQDELDKRWYHLPDFRHYPVTKINLSHGDQWFCTEKEAQKAGFKRARE